MLRFMVYCFGMVLLAASLASAEVEVKFAVSNAPSENTTNALGTLTLKFNVDSAGSVFMDASSTSDQQHIRDAVDAWDGPVGTISCKGAFNSEFSLMFQNRAGPGLYLSTKQGGGLGVCGLNPGLIDGIDSVAVTAFITTGKLEFRSVAWNGWFDPTVQMLLTGPFGSATNTLTAKCGTWDVSGMGFMIGNNETLMFTNADLGDPRDGYRLSGITFDVVENASTTEITIGFVPNTGLSDVFALSPFL
ncbi:MAG: hypothetical protein MUC65_06580 [Pontiellaceae bacterium]|jgi:hypothetical protein|nr:hypothetical protein [Pontiellaceae bacterium]